jgi:hypothetical protein
LQAILSTKDGSAERFWLIHTPANGATQAGIEKRHFALSGSFRSAGVVGQG